MRITDLEEESRRALYILCEDFRAVGDTVFLYRLYATLPHGGRNRFFVSVASEGEEDGVLVPRDGLQEAADLYRTVVRELVAPCHFLDIVEDLDMAAHGVY